MDRNVSVVSSLFTNKLKCIQILVHAFVFYLDIKKRLKGPGNTLYTQRQNSCALQQCFLGNSLLASFVIVFLSRGAPWTCFEMETTTVILLWLSGLALSDESSWKYYTVNIEEKVLLTATVLPGQHCCVLVKIPVHYNSAFFFVALRTCFIGWLFLIGLVFSVAWLG